jgi:hypothetical protein
MATLVVDEAGWGKSSRSGGSANTNCVEVKAVTAAQPI